jgi:hypothetical protein
MPKKRNHAQTEHAVQPTLAEAANDTAVPATAEAAGSTSEDIDAAEEQVASQADGAEDRAEAGHAAKTPRKKLIPYKGHITSAKHGFEFGEDLLRKELVFSFRDDARPDDEMKASMIDLGFHYNGRKKWLAPTSAMAREEATKLAREYGGISMAQGAER